MNPEFSRNIAKSQEEVSKAIYSKSFEKLVNELKEDGSEDIFFDSLKKYLETLNVEPVFESENLDQMRESLNTDSGIIISNHPGYFDSLIILSLLKRKDVKIMVSQRTMPVISKILGPDHFIEASKDPAGLAKQLKEVKKHIESGGVFFIFPTGGKDTVSKQKKEPFQFESGFKFIVDNILADDEMVYSFWVEPDDVTNVLDENIHRTMGTVSDVVTGINLNDLKERKKIHIKEAYSNAKEWKDIASNSQKGDVNAGLANHYLEQFNKQ